jgi:hypothetical protein
MSRTFLIALCLGLVAICGGHARANLVVDGDFETGTPGSPPPAPWVSNDGVVIDNVNPHSGSQDAAMGNSLSMPALPGTLSQMLPTVAGQDYVLDFWLLDEAANIADTFTASLGTFSLPITGDMAPGVYTEFTATVSSADVGANATLSFSATNLTAAWNLDDVSVTAAAAAVPEPAGGALLGTALILWLGLSMPGRLRPHRPN